MQQCPPLYDESTSRARSKSVLGLCRSKRFRYRRDVSLENLLLDEEGIVKLIDFGLALRIPQTADGAARVLPHQGRCGKQYYMSPEVVAPTSAGFDGFAVDVWACGILLFMYVYRVFMYLPVCIGYPRCSIHCSVPLRYPPLRTHMLPQEAKGCPLGHYFFVFQCAVLCFWARLAPFCIFVHALEG